MPKEYKIRRTHGSIYHRDRNKTRSPFSIIVGVLLIGALVAVGWFVYPPVYDLLTGKTSLHPESSQSEPSQPAPASSEPAPVVSSEPEAEAPAEPSSFRAVYAPPTVMRNSEALEALLGQASAAGYSAVMFDAKDANGVVLYNTKNEIAKAASAASELSPFDLSAAVQLMAEYKLQPVARIYTFKDHTAARLNSGMAVTYQNQAETLWLDDYAEKGGKPWLNPNSTSAQDYNIALAQECVDNGVTAVILAGVQFPTARGGLDLAGYGDLAGKTRATILSGFVTRVEETLRTKNAAVFVEAPAAAVLDPTPYDYLGNPAAFSSLVVNAMPSVWGTGNALIGDANPVQNPYAAYLGALKNTQGKTQARLMPYVQAFTDSNAESAGKVYGKTEVTAQLDALKELGIKDYIIYHPDGKYSF